MQEPGISKKYMCTCIPTQNIKGLSLLSLKVQWDGSSPPSPPPPPTHTHISAYGMGTHNNHWRGSSTLGLHLETKTYYTYSRSRKIQSDTPGTPASL